MAGVDLAVEKVVAGDRPRRLFLDGGVDARCSKNPSFAITTGAQSVRAMKPNSSS
ncbi:MAG: hypothetical protein ACRD0U_08630 [Acidimicrobiales bacterium]